MPSDQKDFIKLHFLVVILGFTAILGKLVQIDTLGVVLFRTLVASAGLGVIFYYRKLQIPDKNQIIRLLAIGFVLGIHWICFFGSARMSTVSLSLITFSTTSFFTSVLEPLVKKEPFRPKDMFLGLLAIAGMCLIFTFEFAHLDAILIGLAGALLSAIYTILNARLVKSSNSTTINFFELSGAFLTLLLLTSIIYITNNQLIGNIIPNSDDWIWLLILGIGCTVYPYLEMVKLLEKFSAFTVNLAINMEPVYGIVMAWLIFGKEEKMTPGFYAGAAIILFSLALNAWWRKKERALSAC